MKLNGVIIQDKLSGKYFGFVQQYPGICAQADNIATVQSKLDRYMKAFVRYINIEFTQEVLSF